MPLPKRNTRGKRKATPAVTVTTLGSDDTAPPPKKQKRQPRKVTDNTTPQTVTTPSRALDDDFIQKLSSSIASGVLEGLRTAGVLQNQSTRDVTAEGITSQDALYSETCL